MANKRISVLRWTFAVLLIISSASFAFKPPKPILLTPANSATGQDSVVVFKWDTAMYALSYHCWQCGRELHCQMEMNRR